MTPADHCLDPEVLTGKNELSLYRLARTRYANLSGAGAAIYPGRWNRAGQEAIYTSTERGTPLLEKLVHTPKDAIPSNLSMMEVTLACDWSHETGYEHGRVFLQERGGAFVVLSTLDAARFALQQENFLESVDPFAIALPSVIVPVWNVVLYPSANGFWQRVALKTITLFSFDPRLFPEGTSIRSETAV